MTVVLQQLKGEVSRGVALTDMLIGFQILLDMGDAVFYLVAVVDMQVSCPLTGALVYLYDSPEELFATMTLYLKVISTS